MGGEKEDSDILVPCCLCCEFRPFSFICVLGGVQVVIYCSIDVRCVNVRVFLTYDMRQTVSVRKRYRPRTSDKLQGSVLKNSATWISRDLLRDNKLWE